MVWNEAKYGFSSTRVSPAMKSLKLSSLNVDGCLNLAANVCDLASDVNGKMSPTFPDPSLEPASGAPSPPSGKNQFAVI